MKAIQTRRLPETATKPGRIKIWAEGCKPDIRSIHDCSLDTATSDEQQHKICARTYATWHGWFGNLKTGYLPNGDYCHVFQKTL